MEVAVTGASGFLGGHICAALAAAGHPVRGLVRRPARAPAHLAALGVGLRRAELVDPADPGGAGLQDALAGCGALVANAALGSWQGPLARHLAVNVDGTVRLLRAAAAVGIRRVVLVSTVAVYRTRLNRWMDESAEPYGAVRRWGNPSDLTTDWRYALSKSRGEARAWALARELGLALTVLRPGPIFGPRDPKLTRRYLALHRRRLVLAPTVGVPQVSAGDCAAVVPRALARPETAGVAYNLAGPPTSVVDVLAALRRLTGRGPRVVPLPLPLWVGYRCDRARAALGFEVRALEDALAEVIAAESGAAG